MKTFRIAVLNIVMPTPHSAERYIEMFQKTFALRRIVPIWGRYRGMVGSAYERNGLVFGELYKFFDLDPDSNWFNIARHEQAEVNEVRQIQIPDDLKPHLDRFEFIFVPRRHRFVFVTKSSEGSLSPNLAKRLLETLFTAPAIFQEYGEIEITAEPQRDQLSRILQMPGLKTLTIELVTPNADDAGAAERTVMRRLDQMGAKKLTTELVARANRRLTLDAEHKRLAEVAQSNGSVSATATNEDGRSVEVSTTEHPMVEPVSYDPRTQTLTDVLYQAGLRILNRLSNRN